jgi:DNA-binding NarL/FixJ family response regulator
LLKTAGVSGHGRARQAGDEFLTAGQNAATGSLSGEAATERAGPENRRIIAERHAIDSLTFNERSIMRLITEGKSNTEVAELLNFSPRTVETYRARLMQKLRVQDLVGLVKFAIRHGMSSVD